MLHGIPKEMVLQELHVLGRNRLFPHHFAEDRGRLFRWNLVEIEFPAVGPLTLHGHRVGAVLVEPSANHGVPVGQIADFLAGRPAHPFQVRSPHVHVDIEVLHQQGGLRDSLKGPPLLT